MPHFWKFRVNKWLYGKKNRPYTNANITRLKELLQVPLIDFEEIRKKIDFVLHIPDLQNRLGIWDMSERGIIIVWTEPKDIPETLDLAHFETPILIIWAGYHDRKIVDDVIVSDLKSLLKLANEKIRKRALEVLSVKK